VENKHDAARFEGKHNCTIIQKRNVERVMNYKEISLSCMAYKIYVEVVRLEREVETKDMTPDNQTRFRRERSTLDNIFILMHLIQRQKNQQDKKKV